MTPPQSDYDKRTDELAEEHSGAFHNGETNGYSFTAGRLSAKQSLVDACRALEHMPCDYIRDGVFSSWKHSQECKKCGAIAKIKAEGNYPL